MTTIKFLTDFIQGIPTASSDDLIRLAFFFFMPLFALIWLGNKPWRKR